MERHWFIGLLGGDPETRYTLAAKRFATLAWRQAKTWKDKRSGTEVRLHSKNWLVFGAGVEPVISKP